MNPAKSIQVPTLGFVILDRAAKVPLAGGISPWGLPLVERLSK